ncbi:Secretory immunoglobulin A-binding protein EsiB [Xylophilus ampelinus]|nr:Secretory immunoglobulin A-binding protein EsiB [Xylophilus ampelinus]
MQAWPVMAAMPIEAVDAGALDELKTVTEAAGRARAAGDFAQLATLLRAAAEAGNPTAAEALGLLYLQGNGVEADMEAAVRFWRAAAGQGSARAQRNLDAIGRG